jgi:hypothetical protein
MDINNILSRESKDRWLISLYLKHEHLSNSACILFLSESPFACCEVEGYKSLRGPVDSQAEASDLELNFRIHALLGV